MGVLPLCKEVDWCILQPQPQPTGPQDTRLGGGVLPPSKEAVGILYSSSRLGLISHLTKKPNQTYTNSWWQNMSFFFVLNVFQDNGLNKLRKKFYFEFVDINCTSLFCLASFFFFFFWFLMEILFFSFYYLKIYKFVYIIWHITDEALL